MKQGLQVKDLAPFIGKRRIFVKFKDKGHSFIIGISRAMDFEYTDGEVLSIKITFEWTILLGEDHGKWNTIRNLIDNTKQERIFNKPNIEEQDENSLVCSTDEGEVRLELSNKRSCYAVARAIRRGCIPS